MRLRPFRPLLILASLAVASPVLAADRLIEGARLCTQYFPIEEQKNNIPTHLLAAIATTESGRFHPALGMNIPWPWTINVEGKGHIYESKAEAIAATQKYLREGYRSIDVGCMQVNLKHHNKAFRNLDEAFDPASNVAYAARFLRDNYADLGDWIKATAAYHSRTPTHGNQYLALIERSWNTIVSKVTAARHANVATPQAAAAAAVSAQTPAQPALRTSPSPTASTRNVRVISVRDGTARSNGVLVIRGQLASKPQGDTTTVAPDALPNPTGSSVREVPFTQSAPATQPATSGGAAATY